MTRRGRSLLIGGGALVAAALTAACASLSQWPQTGATFTAKQLCSCLFLTGRSEASCRSEHARYIDRYRIRIDRSDLPRTARVTSRLALWGGEAVYEQGYGCRIVQ
ncbi:MAG TPA: hypothetical protein VEA44_11445 [Caulobacter sp.]|nr:hypothetical protein [Caulobacter sp.]